MLRLFVLVTILLRCVNCSDLRVKAINDNYNHQSVMINSKTYPPDIAPYVVYYPSPADDGTFITAYMGPKTYIPDSVHPENPSAAEGASILCPDDPHYYLYTKKNRDSPVELSITKDNSKGKKYFSRDAPVKILCHGYGSSYEEPFPVRLMNKYLDSIEDVNVILVDWKDLAGDWIYFNSAENTLKVGEKLSLLIQRLVKDDFTDLSKIHFIGHSLGAHVGGSVGYYLSVNSEPKMFRITGLDPAGPGFCKEENKRLAPGDANYVDVIHTAVGDYCEKVKDSFLQAVIDVVYEGSYGLNMSLGHSDFYPNGGTAQPGCPEIGSTCSHSRSYHLLEESIRTQIGFPACKCESWSDYENGKCGCLDEVLMGEKCPDTAKGNYFLKTGPKHPFAKIV